MTGYSWLKLSVISVIRWTLDLKLFNLSDASVAPHEVMLLLLLMFGLLSCSNADTFSLVVPNSTISGQLGSSVVLPCELSTALDIRSYEVCWFRPNKKENPILRYKELQVQENPGDPQYRGRASLVGDLQKGNVSLKLENLTVADGGEYVCHVKSDRWYEDASVFLILPVVGSPPLLSFAEAGEQVNVTCASGGWSPKPTLTWRDKQGTELTDSVNHDYTDSESLVSVSSWLLFSPSESEWISCSVGLSGQEMRESRVLPPKPVHHPAIKTDPRTDPGVSPGWKVATILLVISLLVLTVMTVIFFLKFRGHISQKGTKSTPAEEEARPLVAGPETAKKETNTDKEKQADLSPPSCPVCAERETSRTDGAAKTSDPEPDIQETSTDTGMQGLDLILQGLTISGGTSNHSEPDTQGTSTTEETQAALETAKKETSTDQETQDSVKNETEPEIPDWEKMLSRKVALKPVPSESNLGVLFKERIRSGQYFWKVVGLTRQIQTAPNTKRTFECPKFWYVGVTNDTAALMMLLLLMFDLLSCSNADIFSLVVPDGAVSGQLGSSVVLPCAVSSSLDCTNCKIHWYGPNNNDNLILLYEDLKLQENTGDPQYRGRVSLIGELQKGNVSLKLENLTLADRGEYFCYVSSYKWYERGSVFFTVSVVGSPPVLSCTEAGERMNVTCTSGGWSPNITLTWRDKEGRELRNNVDHFKTDSEGLVSVSSWLLFSPSGSEWISCSIGLSDQEMKEGRVLPIKPASVGLTAGESRLSHRWTAFIISLVISLLLLVVIAALIFKTRVSAVRETNRTDGTTQTSADLNPPPCPVCAVREVNRTDGATPTSDLSPPPCPVCAVRETDGAAQTSDLSPPACPTCAVREVNRTGGAAQTSEPPGRQRTAEEEMEVDNKQNPSSTDSDGRPSLKRKRQHY
ncbi:hypothetical protein MHYP_G00251130 [Metynnis hypsauchen]